jgi:hypothetical protein
LSPFPIIKLSDTIALHFNLHYILVTMPAGYAQLASLMGAHPEVAVFRRFGALNAQNLLYLQAELTHLELELRSTAGANKIFFRSLSSFFFLQS